VKKKRSISRVAPDVGAAALLLDHACAAPLFSSFSKIARPLGPVWIVRVGVTGAPTFNRSIDWDWSDRACDRSVYDYYRTVLWYE
jgi:hypothetical protein